MADHAAISTLHHLPPYLWTRKEEEEEEEEELRKKKGGGRVGMRKRGWRG